MFAGSGEIGLPALRALSAAADCDVAGVITQPDRPAGRGQKLAANPIKRESFQLHLRIFQPENINQPSTLEQIRYCKPDLLVVAAYGQILSKAVLALPALGCLNLHASLLPKFRGASPIQAAIREGERKTGMTIMWMDEGLDTGDILLQQAISIYSSDTAGSLHDRLAALGAPAILKAIRLIRAGKAPRQPQNHGAATYARKLRKEDGHIEWSRPQVELERHIRAMNPWPSAYAWLPDGNDHKMLKVFAAIPSRRASGRPGEVVHVDSHGVLVAAGSGGLLLREVQLEGKRRLPAAEFVRGYPIPPGTLLE